MYGESVSFLKFLPGTGVRKDVKFVKSLNEKNVSVNCPSGEPQKVLVVPLQMTKDPDVALMMNEVRAGKVTMTVDLEGALMMTVRRGGALECVQWMMTVAPDEVMTIVPQGEALMMTVGPVEAWMNPECLDVGQMMTGAPEEVAMMIGEAAGVWMTLAHVVEMMLDPGNLLGGQV